MTLKFCLLSLVATVPDFSRYICGCLILSLLSAYPSLSFTSSLLHILNSESFHPFPCTTLPPFISPCFQLSASVSVAVLTVEGCALSGSCALAASPSAQQPLLLLNVTGPLLLQLSTARVSALRRKMSWLFFETKTVEAGKPQERATALLVFVFFCRAL